MTKIPKKYHLSNQIRYQTRQQTRQNNRNSGGCSQREKNLRFPTIGYWNNWCEHFKRWSKWARSIFSGTTSAGSALALHAVATSRPSQQGSKSYSKSSKASYRKRWTWRNSSWGSASTRQPCWGSWRVARVSSWTDLARWWSASLTAVPVIAQTRSSATGRRTTWATHSGYSQAKTELTAKWSIPTSSSWPSNKASTLASKTTWSRNSSAMHFRYPSVGLTTNPKATTVNSFWTSQVACGVTSPFWRAKTSKVEVSLEKLKVLLAVRR